MLQSITQRIFPGEFSNLTYDAATCTVTPAVDGGTQGGQGGEAGVAGAEVSRGAGGDDAG
jgi:hypothetical protein